MTAALRTLIERLEKAEEGSFELDGAIGQAIGLRVLDDSAWQLITSHDGRDDGVAPVPPYTRSLDAALSLVPEGAYLAMRSQDTGGTRNDPGKCAAFIELNHAPWSVYGQAPLNRLPVALCIACLRARLSEHDHG